ncbi:MAG: hypothetical protein Kow0027_23970 [Saprospiraceae bacterium]
MKKTIFYLSIFAAFTLLGACKDDDGLPGADAGGGMMSATVDGLSWQSKNEDGGAVYAESQGGHVLQAWADDNSYISMTVFGAPSGGSSFVSSNGGVSAQYKPDFDLVDAYIASGALGAATVTFTTFSESKVKGTFTITGVLITASGQQEVQITNGSFEFDL